MKIKKLSQMEFIELLLLLVLYYSQGANILNIGNSIATALVSVIILIFLYRRFCVTMPKYALLLFSILLINHLLTGFAGGAGLLEGFNFSTWLEMFFFYFGVYFVYQIDPENAMTKFIKIVVFFALISIVCYCLALNGQGDLLSSIFPSRWGTGTRQYCGSWFYAYCSIFDRNNGVFYEPGVNQISLVMCIFAMLFMPTKINLSERKKATYLVILIIALITTKSTTGYMGLAVIVAFYLFKKKERSSIAIGATIILVMLYLVYDYYARGVDSLVQTYLIGKLNELSSRDITLSSGGARVVAMQLGVEAALNHPFGIGYLNWERQLQAIYGVKFGTGNALFSTLGIRGFCAFFCSLFLAIMPAIKTMNAYSSIIVYIFLFINITTAQGKVFYPAILMVAFLMYADLEESQKFKSYYIA